MYVAHIGALNSKFLEWKRAEFQRDVSPKIYEPTIYIFPRS